MDYTTLFLALRGTRFTSLRRLALFGVLSLGLLLPPFVAAFAIVAAAVLFPCFSRNLTWEEASDDSDEESESELESSDEDELELSSSDSSKSSNPIDCIILLCFCLPELFFVLLGALPTLSVSK